MEFAHARTSLGIDLLSLTLGCQDSTFASSLLTQGNGAGFLFRDYYYRIANVGGRADLADNDYHAQQAAENMRISIPTPFFNLKPSE